MHNLFWQLKSNAVLSIAIGDVGLPEKLGIFAGSKLAEIFEESFNARKRIPFGLGSDIPVAVNQAAFIPLDVMFAATSYPVT